MLKAPIASSVADELLRAGLLRRVASTLAASGIPVMPLKGALFAYWIYDDPEERLGGDIDVLVPGAAFEQAMNVLTALGFVPDPPHSNPN